MVLGPNAILLYGSEKYIGGGILTSLFAFRTIILALDTIIGSQILFINSYEKRITVYTVFAGLLNLGLNSLLFFNNIVAPEYYLLTTMLSEASLFVFYIIFIHRKQLIHLGHIFSYTIRYSLFSLSFVGIYFLINFLYPVDMVINLPFLINTGLIALLSAISYIALLVFTKDSLLKDWIRTDFWLLLRPVSPRYFANKIEKEIQKYSRKNGHYMAFIPSKFKEKEVFPSATFDKTIDLPFENLTLPAPEKFDTILTQFYGDYMTLPPEEKRFYSHEFHAYKLED